MTDKIMHLLLSVLVVSLVGLVIPSAFAENVPDWVKNTAGWWADDAISETEFVNAIEYLVKEDIIRVNVLQTSETSQSVPDWVKNTAGWWATDAISETEFVNAISYLVKVGIISIESSKSPELIAEMWTDGHITDDEFIANVEQLIEKNIITIQSDSITKTSQLPDWLVNNAGWWAARIFTNSDFNFDPGYVKEELYPCIELSTDIECFTRSINSHGFRGDEFQKEKPNDTFRIFAVGGSTTNGSGSDDDETWPAHLQKIANEKITGKKIEVINAGMSGATSEQEHNMIKNKISLLDPDLVIVYDGWNDWDKLSVENTIQNWESVCKLGKNKGFDTIIAVQPLAITGNRVPTEQESATSLSVLPYLQKSQQYVDAFEKLDNVCTKTADLRRVFDYVQEPIFYDAGHTMSFGNKIIAKNIFSVISPIYFGEVYPVTQSDLQIENDEPGIGVVYAVGANLSGKNFDNLNLQNAVFDKADLSNTSFKNANIEGARFAFANLDNSNLLDRTDLHNVNLAGIDLSMKSLKGKDLSSANLSNVDLSKHDLTGTNLIGATLSYAKFSSTGLKGKDLSSANLSNVDLSKHDLTGTNLSDTFLLRTNLSGMDLRSTILTGADFRYANLSESKLPDSLLVNNNFDYAELKYINFAGKDLSGSSFKQASIEGSDMQNTNLYEADFIQVDFTKIKNKSLAGANLFGTSFAHSNLSDVSLDGVSIIQTNFWKTDLSGQDFTVISNKSSLGSKLFESNLSNANFEGVDLSPQEIISTEVFKNKASLMNLSDADLIANLYGKADNKFILSKEISGNDLVLELILFNNFARANLENANFKNADLRYAGFYLADLTNADLSGADLRNAYFGYADLSNANLEGANLEGANLKCINHPICESG
jgi:uncharacterized protein YjbI with pentapeptide repeats/lysophospholipase L1-like esterase